MPAGAVASDQSSFYRRENLKSQTVCAVIRNGKKVQNCKINFYILLENKYTLMFKETSLNLQR
jgi:hypothetical protein